MIQSLSLTILATTIITRIWYTLLSSTLSHRDLLEQLCLHEQQGRDVSLGIFSMELSHPPQHIPVLVLHPETLSFLSPFSFSSNSTWSNLHLVCSHGVLLIYTCQAGTASQLLLSFPWTYVCCEGQPAAIAHQKHPNIQQQRDYDPQKHCSGGTVNAKVYTWITINLRFVPQSVTSTPARISHACLHCFWLGQR